ncbi:MAG: cysteine synthase A [Erysipelotrichaceae bacterium]|nr:cysteine synthase A [Erysipelotrichaceae bacterium]MDD4643235.1 cysteine synthase A [Erysipelotrichaceae bacterium]
MKIYENVIDLIGNTPLLKLNGLMKKYDLKANIIAKLEKNNPAGSVKDRIARAMILDAETRGLLRPGSTIIEPTSGNTGIGLAYIGKMKGYQVIIVMPDTMSVERQRLIKAYGARLVLTPGNLGMKGAIAEAFRLKDEIKDSFIPSQFDNQSNPKAHFDSTGPEIYKDTDGQVDIFIAGIGTGGTITGVGRYLKAQDPNIEVIGIEPKGSAVLSTGKSGSHKIQGIGAGFVPNTLDTTIYDRIITIEDSEALQATLDITDTDGIFVGISAGAAIAAAVKVALQKENIGKNIVIILPDGGERYLSMDIHDIKE